MMTALVWGVPDKTDKVDDDQNDATAADMVRIHLNPILPEGGQNTPPFLFFLHHPKTAQGIKLKLSENFELLPWQQNYKRYLAEFGSKEK